MWLCDLHHPQRCSYQHGVRRLLRLLLLSFLLAKSPTDLCMRRALGSPTTIHAHEFHFSQYDNVYNNTIFGSVTQWTKLCTAVVAGVHLYQPTRSLWGETKQHNVYCKTIAT